MKLVLLILIFLSSLHQAWAQGDTLNYKEKCHIVKQGYWTVYGKDQPEKGYCDTCRIEEGLYVNGEKSGVWIFYHPNGTVRTIGTFNNYFAATSDTLNKYGDNGWKQGYWILYGKDFPEKGYCDSCRVEEGRYLEDRRTGEWKLYHPNGIVRLIGEWEHGRPTGPYRKYDSTGVLISSGTFSYTPSCSPVQIKEESVCNWGSDSIQFTLESDHVLKLNRIDSVDIGDPGYWEENVSTPFALGGSTAGDGGFDPNGVNNVYSGFYDLWLSGEFKNGYLWSGKQYLYDSEGNETGYEIWKKGKIRRTKN